MIQPESIARKAETIYREYQKAWLAGDNRFFPRLVPAQRDPGTDLVKAIAQVQRLREGSKQMRGHGYSVAWREVDSRRHGRNQFPERITIDSEADLLALTGKERDFRRFTAAVERIRGQLPELDKWLEANIRLLSAPELEVDGLVAVVLPQRQPPCSVSAHRADPAPSP